MTVVLIQLVLVGIALLCLSLMKRIRNPWHARVRYFGIACCFGMPLAAALKGIL